MRLKTKTKNKTKQKTTASQNNEKMCKLLSLINCEHYTGLKPACIHAQACIHICSNAGAQAGGNLLGFMHPPLRTHSNHFRVLYLLIVLFLYIFLNLISETQFFCSSSKLFHNLTPLTDTHLPLMFTLQ